MAETSPQDTAEPASVVGQPATPTSTPSPPATVPAPAAPAATSRLLKLNTNVTLLAAVLSALLGVGTGVLGLWLKAGEARLQEVEQKSKDIEAQIKALDARSKSEDASYKFAREFLAQVKDSFGQTARGKQMAVAALNIIAQASTSGGGESSAHSRAELPLHMALLIGDPGSLVMLDPDLQHLEDWFDFATADAEDSTRVTAIQALCSLSKKAVQQGRLDRLERCTTLVEQLLTYLAGRDALEAHTRGGPPTVPPTPEMTAALVAMTRLQIFFTEHDAQVQAARLPPGDPRDPRAVLAGVQTGYEKAVGALQEVNHQLTVAENTVLSSEPARPLSAGLRVGKGFDPDGMDSSANGSGGASGPAGPLQRTRAMVADALQAVTLARQSAASSAAPSQPAAADAQRTWTDRLIGELLSDDPGTQHHGHLNLALLRQAAIGPMTAALRQHEGQQDAATERLRLGVAVALSRMIQPIVLSLDDARQVVALLGAGDADTRTAAGDFLIDLDGASTIQNVFDAIQSALASQKGPTESGNLVYNTAVVLATWTRVLPEKTVGRDGQPFRKTAFDAVTKLTGQLHQQDARGWAKTLEAADHLLQQTATGGAKPSSP